MIKLFAERHFELLEHSLFAGGPSTERHFYLDNLELSPKLRQIFFLADELRGGMSWILRPEPI